MITRRELMFRIATAAGAAFFFLPLPFPRASLLAARNRNPAASHPGVHFSRTSLTSRKQAGLIEPIVYGGIETKNYIVEVVGAGVAFIDYDNDGWMDLFILNGTKLEGDPPGVTNRLYKNNRDGTFTDVTAKAGLTRAGWASAVTVADYDNDGFDDIFITYYGHNVLYRQQRQRHIFRCDQASRACAECCSLRFRLHLGRL